MSEFRVTYSNNASILYSGEGSRYSFRDNGVLMVFDGKGQRFLFSPSGWLSIEEAEREHVVPTIEVQAG